MRFFLFTCSIVLMAFPSGFARADDLRAVYEQATDAYTRGDFAQSVELFNQVTEMAPRFAPAYAGLGMALKSNGADIDEVLYNYKKATDLDPNNVEILEQAGRLYYSLNKFDKAEDAYLKALKANPNLTDIKFSLAWLYLIGKPRPEQAAKYFKQVLKSAPTSNAYFGLGMAYFANNDREKALEMITTLKGMGEEDLAKKLETAVRENRKVVLQAPVEEPVPEPQIPAADTEPAAVSADTSAATAPVGVKVRLREKLSVIK